MASEAVKIPFIEAAAPSTPAASRVVVYAKSDGLMYSKDDAGTETLMSSGSVGNVATDPIFDAKGDLPVGTGANTAAKLTAGANGTVPTYASGETTGMIPAYPPGYELDYAQITSNVSITSTTTGDNVVSGAGFTSDGTAVIVEFYAIAAEPSNAAAGRNIQILLVLDGTQLGPIAYIQTPAAAVLRVPVLVRRKITPSSGSRTFSIKALVSAGTGTVYAGAGTGPANMPAYIRVTKA